MSTAAFDWRKGSQLPPMTVPGFDREALHRFAVATNDDNPIHLDPTIARTMGFDDVITHGMLAMAQLSRMLLRWVPQSAVRSIKVRFVAVTPVGKPLHCNGKVLSRDGDIVKVSLQASLPDGTVTVRGTAVLDVTPS